LFGQLFRLCGEKYLQAVPLEKMCWSTGAVALTAHASRFVKIKTKELKFKRIFAGGNDGPLN